MGWFQNLLGRSDVDFSQNGHSPKFGVEVDPAFLEGDRVGAMFSEARVSRKEALKVPAVLRARNLIAGTLSTLPIHIRGEDRLIAHPTTLLDQIDPDVANVITLASTYEDLMFESVAWWRITQFGWHGYPVAATHVKPQSVHASPTGVYIDGRLVSDREVIRFDSPNPPLLVHAARAIKICLMLDNTAGMYAESPMPLGYFTPKDDAEDADEEVIQETLDAWERARRTRAWGYVGKAWAAEKLQFDAEQIQLADQRQHAVLEIARATGIDPEDLGVSTTSRTYQNAETRRQERIIGTYGAYIAALEQRLSMRDVLPRPYAAKVNLDAFLRPDTKTRMETYAIGKPIGAITTEEIRELEDRPPLSDDELAEIAQSEPQPMEPVND